MSENNENMRVLRNAYFQSEKEKLDIAIEILKLEFDNPNNNAIIRDLQKWATEVKQRKIFNTTITL